MRARPIRTPMGSRRSLRGAAVAGAIWPPRGNRTSWIDRWMGAISGLVVGPILAVVILVVTGGPGIITLGVLGYAAVAGAVLGALVPAPFVFLFDLLP